MFIAPSTFHPKERWVEEQTAAFLRQAEEAGLGVQMVMHDRDTKFTAKVNAVLENADAEVRLTAFRSPNTNAYVERFIQTLQQECLDHFVVFGEEHMDYLVSEFLEHYHTERPHQSKENEVLVVAGKPPDGEKEEQVCCRERLGGRLRHYYRAA